MILDRQREVAREILKARLWRDNFNVSKDEELISQLAHQGVSRREAEDLMGILQTELSNEADKRVRQLTINSSM